MTYPLFCANQAAPAFRRLMVVLGRLLCLVVVTLQCHAAEAWIPPTGIPIPEFGITDSHQMYDDPKYTYDFGSGFVRYPTTPNGPFTHYVDMTHASATDVENPFGTPDKPRKTWPSDLPAGSVVEIHGGPYNFKNYMDKMAVYGEGTKDRPIFVRGASKEAAPIMDKDISWWGSYIIVENLQMRATRFTLRADLTTSNSHHLAVRHLVLKGTGLETANSTAVGGIGRWANPDGPTTNDIVVYGNKISDYGDRNPLIENDWIGVSVGGYNAQNVWIIDNEIYQMGADSIRVGSNPTPYPYNSSMVYVGRNRVYDNGENAIDIKGVKDVVISGNYMKGFSKSSSDPGAAVVLHYRCENIWLLNNSIFEAAQGISASDAGDVYIVGNVISEVEDGIRFWSSVNELHFIGNTIHNMGSGINDIGAGSKPHPVINNIFSELKDPSSGYHIKMQSAAASNSEMHHNVIFQSNGAFRVYWGKLFTSLPSFQLATGKGANCSVKNPLYMDVTARAFGLQDATSSAVDAGTPPTYYTELYRERFGLDIQADIFSVQRPQGSAWDIGALERVTSSPPSSPTKLRVTPR